MRNETINISKCGFVKPYLMKGDFIIDMDVGNDKNVVKIREEDTNLNSPLRQQLLMMEINSKETSDPENTEFQYVFDTLQQEFRRRLREIHERSCQNRNDLLSLIKWLLCVDPTTAVEILLQRNDVMTKNVKGKLLIAPCQSEEIKTKFVDFEKGIINKFEIEKLNAEWEILAHKQETINSINHQQGSDTLWGQIGQQGEELAEQLEH
ncbi:unnamed protein product, partial [Onchocerca ochengi]|uniref:Uncharacterized protein n=1 Tax=Onchocerca ochengi TaxID=42157 RepID=A0A182EYY7_ONCOC